MDRKKLCYRLTFGALFITISAIGASFIAKGVNGIIGERNNSQTVDSNPLLPNFPTGQDNNLDSQSIDKEGNVDIDVNTQPLTWGEVSHYKDKPDEYHSFIQYRNLVKVKGMSSSESQGVIMDFINPNDPAMIYDTEAIISFMHHIYVKGYVYFAGAKSDTTGTDGGSPMYFPFGDKYTLYQLLSNNTYIDITNTNSMGYYVPPTYISLSFSFSTDEWYNNGTKYAFNFAGRIKPVTTFSYKLNIIGYNK